MGPLKAIALAGLIAGGCAARAPTAMRDKGLEPSLTTLDALATVRPPRRLALVIGVNAYGDPTFPPLHHAADDARALAELLASPQAGDFDEVVTLVDPSRAEALDALRALAATARREDALMVYFSGHGTRVEDGRRYLLLQDSRARELATSALELEALQTWFGTVMAGRRLLIVDACFDGEGKSVVSPTSGVGLPSVAPRPALGEAHLYATSAGRPSREYDRLGHGVYSYFLLDAMSWSFTDADVDEDGLLTAWEAHDHARSRTMEHTEGVQVPEAAIHTVGMADVVLAGASSARAARERSLVYLYPMGGQDWTGVTLTVDGRDKGVLPGTVPLSPGRHHVVMRSPDGEVAVDGLMRFAPGLSYRADEVVRLAQGPSRMAGWRLASAMSPPLERAVGTGVVGPELAFARRRNEGTGVGWLTLATLAAGAAPTRLVDGALIVAGRPVFWGSVSSGYQTDRGQLRARLALGAGPVWVPPSYRGEAKATDPYAAPSQAGWLFAAAGPTVGLGWVLGRGWTVQAEARPHVGVLDVDGDGRLGVVPWATGSLGIEADL